MRLSRNNHPAGGAAGPEGHLADLARAGPGAAGVVRGIEGNGATAERLRALGFVPGTEVRYLRRAPLGEPLVFELRGFRLCLRRPEARRIRIRRLSPTEA